MSRAQAPAFVVHSHLRWDGVWQRPQQIFSRLARNSAVLFIEEPKWCDGLRQSDRLDIDEPAPNVWRVVPEMVTRDGLTVDACAERVLSELCHVLGPSGILANRFEAPVQWFYSPLTAPVMLGAFGSRCIVYDCMDELANFRFAHPELATREQLLMSRADIVFTGGYQLYDAKRRHHGNVHMFGCGVDTEHFGRARSACGSVPAELQALPRPVFGYFGVVDERIDYVLLAELARACPQGSIVMVGPLAKVDPAELPVAPNIHWFGKRNYDELPDWVRGYDVCLMPFALNEATKYINPTKTLEYLAAGKPVVSTAIADVVMQFGDVVQIADSRQGFVQAVVAAARPDAQRISEGVRRASQASWDGVVRHMQRLIERHRGSC